MKVSWIVFGTVIILGATSVPCLTADESRKEEAVKQSESWTVSRLQQEIESLREEREETLTDLAAQYRSAPPEERTMLEARRAAAIEDYERAFYSLLVEYHQFNGNETELEQASRMLETLNSGLQRGTPLNLERNLSPDQSDRSRETVGGDSQ